MAKLKKVAITEIDLEKLCKKKGISMRQLAIKAGVNYVGLTRVKNGVYSMTEEYWNKLKIHL